MEFQVYCVPTPVINDYWIWITVKNTTLSDLDFQYEDIQHEVPDLAEFGPGASHPVVVTDRVGLSANFWSDRVFGHMFVPPYVPVGYPLPGCHIRAKGWYGLPH